MRRKNIFTGLIGCYMKNITFEIMDYAWHEISINFKIIKAYGDT
jgi:hypothetical protein